MSRRLQGRRGNEMPRTFKGIFRHKIFFTVRITRLRVWNKRANENTNISQDFSVSTVQK